MTKTAHKKTKNKQTCKIKKGNCKFKIECINEEHEMTKIAPKRK